MERVAFRQTPYSHPESSRRAVRFYGLHHVLRTRRIEAAGGWQEWRNQSLIPAEGEDETSPDTSVEAEAAVEAEASVEAEA